MKTTAFITGILVGILLALLTVFLAKKANAQSFIWPASCPISAYFNPPHNGIDLACDYGAAVVEAEGGTVTFAGWDLTGYGWMVVTDNGYNVKRYAHLDTYNVWPGQYVYQGQQIGNVGSSGWSTGPHLHFEILWGGMAVNPLVVLP